MAPPRGRERWQVPAGQAALLLLLVAFWAWGHRAVGDTFVAAPAAVAQRIGTLVASGALWPHLGATLFAAALGFVFGWLAGFALPLVLGRSRRLMSAIEPFIIAAMGIPLYALVPLLILWFGIGMTPKVVIVAFMVLFIVFVSTLSGLRALEHRLVNMARVLGANEWQLTMLIRRQAMLPFLFSGLRLAVPRAISAAIVGEFLVADRGLGFYIEHSRQTADTVGVFAGIVLVTLLVLGCDMLLAALQRRQTRWQQTLPGGVS